MRKRVWEMIQGKHKFENFLLSLDFEFFFSFNFFIMVFVTG